MLYDQVTELRLHRLEKELSTLIKDGTLPFLGHYANFLYDNLTTSIHAKLGASNDSTWRYYESLNRWPAVFSTYLIQSVAKGYGQDGTHAVYPFIDSAIHTNLSQSEKESLRSKFRSACIKLGLSVSPRRGGSNYMIEEYLRQSGVPLQYVETLVEKMYGFASDVGVPDDDDPAAIRLWQSGLKTKIIYLPKTVQKTISADDEGFYVRLFSRLLRTPCNSDNSPEIDKLFSKHIEQLKNRDNNRHRKNRTQSLSIPQFIFREGQIGVELPAGEEVNWRIDVDGKIETYAGTLEKRFIPFMSQLPEKVAVNQTNGLVSISKEFWPDEKNNRFLVIGDSGELICKGHLGQEDVIFLEPGAYDLLLRFTPSNLEEECEHLSDEPFLTLYRLTLDPAQAFDLVRGPAKAHFKADTKPAFAWIGDRFRGIMGNELYASADLCLEIKIPEELYRIGGGEYELKIDSGDTDCSVVVPLPQHNLITIDMSRYVDEWQPGLIRLLVELRRKGFQRAETRSAVFCWNGLQRVKNRTEFVCSRLPSESNLLANESDNLKIDSEKNVVTFRNEDQRVFRMVFQLPGGRRQSFTWTVPGVFMQLIDYQGGQATERPLKKGSFLSVTRSSREVLELFSSNNGVIEFGTLRKVVDFDRVGRVRLPVAGLVDYIGPVSDKLRFIDSQTQFNDELLRIVSPHHILSFKASQNTHTCKLFFSTKNEVEELSLRFKDLLTGREKEVSAHCNASGMQGEDGFSVWFSCPPKNDQGLSPHELQFHLDNWPNGAWFVTLNGKINGRWGRFSNARNDHFSYGMIIVDNQVYSSDSICWKYIQSFESGEKEKILKRIHRRLMNCYARESWDQLEWLGSLWRKLVEDLRANGELSPNLISLAEERDEGGNENDWVPLYSMATHIPLLYSQRGCAYRELPNPRQLLSVKGLKILGQMKGGVLPLLTDQILNNLVVLSFSNPHEIMAGKPARNFKLKNFEDALKGEDVSERLRLLRQHEWQPGDGDYLGSLHYRFAVEQLAENFRSSFSGNEYRRGKALSLCRNIGGMALAGAPSDIVSGQVVIDLNTEVFDEDYVMPMEEEHVKLIIKFLSKYARACRWEVRHPGCLKDIWKQSRLHLGSEKDFELVLGYLLSLGKDVFLYYLMLWEAAFRTDAEHQEGSIYVRM